MPNIKQSAISVTKDANGNVTEETRNYTMSWGEEPPYVKFYLQDIMYLKDIPKAYSGLVYALLRYTHYAGQNKGMCVVLVSDIKRDICEELGWKTIASLDNALQKLIAGNIIERVGRGIYRFNPYLFGRGNWQEIAKLRVEISYDRIKGRTFSTNLEYTEGGLHE